MKNFALVGVAGYIAPRHLLAIKDTGNNLTTACDPSDSVGVLDKYFFDARYFREFERFDRHIEKLRRGPLADRVHYVSVCSPNYLHDAHIRFALRVGAHAICEKPLVINPWNLDPLVELETEYSKRIFVILQLRMHPALIALRAQLAAARAQEPQKSERKHEVVLTYVTSRGAWYLNSWKGSVERSGGLATNIGIHFFDLLMWLFGNVQATEVHLSEPSKVSGFLELERATVKWYLSIDRDDLPTETVKAGRATHRSITVDGKEIEFSEGFADLHTAVYRDILAGRGFGIEDARPSIVASHTIRNAHPVGKTSRSHALLRRG